MIDHSRFVKDYLKVGINVYSSAECKKQTGCESDYNFKEFREQTKIGNFNVLPFDLIHDCRNFGYLISHPETGTFCFITDTHYSPFRFANLNNVIVEANYCEEILNENQFNGRLPSFVYERTKKSHMAKATTEDFLRANDLTKVNNIVLIHLSNGNINATKLKSDIQNLTGKKTHIATPGLEIDFNKNAF